MKKILALAALAGITAAANAQLNPLPPSSTTDGVTPTSADANWASSPLNAYKFASDDNLHTPDIGTPDNILGLNWLTSAPASISGNLATINHDGGSVRIIFVGESAGWHNSFGYTYSGLPSDIGNSFTIWSNIQAAGPTPDITFGDNATVTFNPGDAANFDIWLDAVGIMGDNPPALSNTQDGGVYTAIDPSNSVPYLDSGNAKWAQTSLAVDTNTVDGVLPVNTWLVSFEDWNLHDGADDDFNDMMVALQFYDSNGTPLTPVPEPSTYGLIGAAALLGLVARRRFAKK